MKKLFALLLVLVMVIALVPTAVAATEAEGTPSAVAGQETPGDSKGDENPENPENSHKGHMATWKIDTTTHTWYCLSCNVAINAAEPHSYNPTTHRCTVCGIPDSNYCNHTDTKYVSAGSEGHIQYCTNCSARLSSVEPHHAVGNECDLCGYDGLGCSHEHTRWDCNSEWHGLFCLDCSNCIKEGNHVGMDDGVCDECGYGASDPNHCDHKNVDYIPAGSEGHVKYCSDCFADLSDIEPHHRVGNVCDLCGFDKFDCSHEHTVWSYNDNYHHLLCKDCNTIIDDGEHVGMNDGICDKCGFKTNAEHHFLPGSHDCTDPGCNYRSFCSDPNGDGKCDTCGAPGHFGDVIWKDLDDNSHEAICSECKESMWTASHYDDDNDGKCDACGHKMSGTTGGGTTGGKENTGLDKVPKTGDVMAPVAILSGLMSVAAVFTRKRFF